MAADMITTEQAITGGGIRSVNFFNGRLLTGEDLTREQDANRLGRLRLGRALGSGVASGLNVTAAPASSNARPVVRVQAGLAVNPNGRVLELATATDVSLARRRPDGSGPDVLFADCAPLQPGTYTAGTGVYLLTIAPAQTADGRAPLSGLGNEDVACNIAFSIEGVQFHLLRIALPPSLLNPPERLRSRLAHLLLGTADARRTRFGTDPLGPPIGRYGLLDDLHDAGCFDDEQVPLAILSWTASQGIRFVDLWAVRRRIVEPAADTRFPTLAGDRRAAEAEAAFLQFQEHVAELTAAGEALSQVHAADHFAFLPAVGIVPIVGKGSLSGFDPDLFLGAQGSDELATLDAAQLRALVRESLAYDPIEVGAGKRRVQRYVVWENQLAVEGGTVGRRALVFAHRTLPYRGTARFGRAVSGRSRFAPSAN
jgi:hypothetical protein